MNYIRQAMAQDNYTENTVDRFALVTSHLKLVVAIVMRYYRGPDVDVRDEMIQEGNVALIQAAESWDPERGIRFASYAIPHIRYAIMGVKLDNQSIINLCTTKAQRKVYYNIGRYRQGGALTPDAIAAMARDLDLSEEQIREAEQRLATSCISTSATANGEDEEFTTDWLADSRYEPTTVLALLEREWIINDQVHEMIDTLPAREQQIIRERWLNGRESTLHDLAAELGVSAERVRQLEVQALGRLRRLVNQRRRFS